MDKIVFFDTTLRDGEQAPGFSMKIEEKLQLAKQLEKLGVDIIEAGFAISSDGDFESIKLIAKHIKKSSICSLARANKLDIDRAYEALKDAKKPRIHIFIATSDLHLKYKLNKTRVEALQIAVESVAYAKTLFNDIEFSCEDATRSDKEFLVKIIEAVINAGAKTINLPDTVGYTTPDEIFEMVSYVIKNVPNVKKAKISVHNHNDLGLAVANSLAAIRAGATQIECTINGIGERAGNAALEEIVMAMSVRSDIYSDVKHNINTKEIYRSSKLLSTITGVNVQPNKAIVGKNAFAHESGIHQAGMLKNRKTYEIMTPESVGIAESTMVLGKHSGRNALVNRLGILGYKLSKDELEECFIKFKLLADKKKEVFDEDLEVIVLGQLGKVQIFYELDYIGFNSGTDTIPTVTMKLKKDDGTVLSDSNIGDGPIDAAFKTIERIVGIESKLKSYKLASITPGKDAQGDVTVSVEFNKCGYNTGGKGFSTDILIASVEAYLSALNSFLRGVERVKPMNGSL